MPFDGTDAAVPDVLILRNAKSLIDDPQLWAQKGFYRRGGRRCILQALRDACEMHYHRRLTRPSKRGRAEVHVKRLAGLLAQELPKGWFGRIFARSRIIRFNDNKRRRHADIMSLFDRTIARRRLELVTT